MVSLSLDVEYLLLVGSRLFLPNRSPVSCDSGVFVKGGELKSFYSTSCLLSQRESFSISQMVHSRAGFDPRQSGSRVHSLTGNIRSDDTVEK